MTITMVIPDKYPVKVVVCVSIDFSGVFLNWLSHFRRAIADAPLSQQLHVVCLDERVGEVLNRIGVKCESTMPTHAQHEERAKHKGVVASSSSSSSPVRHTRTLSEQDRLVPLHLIWRYRTEVVSTLLEQGHSVIMSDVDSIWVRDPLRDILSYPIISESNAPHIIATRGTFPDDAYTKWGATLCMGFAYVRSTPATVAFFNAVQARLRLAILPDDQREINDMLLNEFRLAFRRFHASIHVNSTELMHGRSSGRATGRGPRQRDALFVSLLPVTRYPRECGHLTREDVSRHAVVIHCVLNQNANDKTLGLGRLGLWDVDERAWRQVAQAQATVRETDVGKMKKGEVSPPPGGFNPGPATSRLISSTWSFIFLIFLVWSVVMQRCRADSSIPSPVGIVVMHTNPNMTHCDCAQHSVVQYAKEHAYTYQLVREDLRTVETSGHEKMHPKFQKYVRVRDMLTSHSTVLLMDCDVAVTNASVRVEDVWARHSHANGSTSMIIARDAWSNRGYIPFNTGVILFKRTDWTTAFLDDVITKQELKHPAHGRMWGAKHGLKDQPRLIEEVFSRSELIVPPLALNTTEMHEHVSIVPQRVMNAFKRRGKMFKYTDPKDSRWRPGDWLVHATGMARDYTRLAVLKDDLHLC